MYGTVYCENLFACVCVCVIAGDCKLGDEFIIEVSMYYRSYKTTGWFEYFVKKINIGDMEVYALNLICFVRILLKFCYDNLFLMSCIFLYYVYSILFRFKFL